MHRSQILFWSLLSFVFGVAVELLGILPSGGLSVMFVIFAISIAVTFLQKEYIAITIILLGFLLGTIRASSGIVTFRFLEPVRVTLESIRDSFNESIARALPDPQGAYLSGLLTGAKSDIPVEIRDAFRDTGTSHLVALSGYNVTVIAQFIGRLFSSLWPSVIGIILFVLATGAPSSVVRAAIMGVLVLVARKYKHDYSMGTALLFAAAVMIAVSPEILTDDIGFQLSVAATWGLITLTPKINPYLKWLPEKLGARESASATFAAQAATFPLIFYYFGTFSILSPITNVLVLIAVPYTMFFGFIAGLAGYLNTTLAAVISWPAYLLLTYQLEIIKLFASF